MPVLSRRTVAALAVSLGLLGVLGFAVQSRAATEPISMNIKQLPISFKALGNQNSVAGLSGARSCGRKWPSGRPIAGQDRRSSFNAVPSSASTDCDWAGHAGAAGDNPHLQGQPPRHEWPARVPCR